MRSILIALSLLPVLTFAADGPAEVSLWPAGSPGLTGANEKEVVVEAGKNGARERHVSNVHNPTITVYLPPKEKATRTAVIICPGGGFNILAIDHEGYDVAEWLNSIGVAGFVLKYRLANTKGYSYAKDTALLDAQRAVRMVRSRAQEWGIDPARVGVLGFSAGGEVAAMTGTRFDGGDDGAADTIERQSSRPGFLALIYPGFMQDLRGLNVTGETPPSFLVHANDDRLSAEISAAFYLALKKANVTAELHVYAHGGHGFGMRKGPYSVSSWPARFQDWMAESGLLGKNSVSASR
jgi:acetyl esterase/lipase